MIKANLNLQSVTQIKDFILTRRIGKNVRIKGVRKLLASTAGVFTHSTRSVRIALKF